MGTTGYRTAGWLSSLALTAGTMGSAAACEIKLGAAGPLSGPAAQRGQAIKGAADLAAAEANKAGGLQVGKEKCNVSVLAVGSKGSFINKLCILPSDSGCAARRGERSVASHTSESQQRSAPEASEKNAQLIYERAHFKYTAEGSAAANRRDRASDEFAAIAPTSR